VIDIRILPDKRALGQAAAEEAAALLKDAIARQGQAHVVAATGASQFEFLDALTATSGLDWSKTVFFHLDEYVGIGENGHLAFNDPPADFETREPYLVVELDEACRRQQLGEGWFKTLEDVPQRAISMSVAQILRSGRIVCVVPDARKAKAVRDSVRGGVSPLRPASALQQHGATTVYLDPDSAALL
jgi:glucosamine-6-phosphate deaminase